MWMQHILNIVNKEIILLKIKCTKFELIAMGFLMLFQAWQMETYDLCIYGY